MDQPILLASAQRCERSPKALAMPCFGDAARELGTVIDEALRAAGLSIAPAAKASCSAPFDLWARAWSHRVSCFRMRDEVKRPC